MSTSPRAKRRPSEPLGALRAHTTTSGMLLAGALVPAAVLRSACPSLVDCHWWMLATCIGAILLLLTAGLTITTRPFGARMAATVAVVATLALGTDFLKGAPAATLAVLIACTGGLALLWKVGAPLIGLSTIRHRTPDEGRAQGAAIATVGIWLLGSLVDREKSLLDAVVVGWAAGLSALLSLRWAIRHRPESPRRVLALFGAGTLAVILAPLAWGNWWWVMSPLVVISVVSAATLRSAPRFAMDQGSWWEPLLGHPERLFVGTFAGLCVVGTAILALPQSSSSGHSIGFADAAFTSTSAVCVTGLIVLDTPADFSAIGQVFLLLLIQFGGLGIMTFSTAALWALGRRMSLRHEGAVASLISTQDRGRLYATARRILVFTASSEGLGALILTLAFWAHGDTPARALWRGVFTSISAFCNAGFALQSDSLIPYQHAPLVLHTVALLIVLGGISPLAAFAVPTLVARSARPVTAQARLVLASAAALLFGGFLCILAFEWKASLAHLPMMDRVHNAWFQSVTLRTAGFNSVDIAIVHPATYSLMLLWMFIGGSPGGTAGGVKTTTVSVLVLSVVQAIRGQWTLEVFGKRIPERNRAKAAVTVVVAAATGLIALIAIQLTQAMPSRLAVFEVVSALGTVGLSIGGTAELDGIGKGIIIVCMFVGRVGGLTLLMFLSTRRAPPLMGRPAEEIDVG